jgi:uncharacterized Zn-binding protein involved in type VI secretion
MPRLGRIMFEGDYAKNPKHSCSRCRRCGKHFVKGPAVTGSPNVFIDGHPVVRVGDVGKHEPGVCCGGNHWEAFKSVTNTTVYVNDRLAFCDGDITRHDGTDLGTWVVTDCFVGAEMRDDAGPGDE